MKFCVLDFDFDFFSMVCKQPFDVNKTIDTLEPEVSNGGGGLFVPKDRPMYIAPASKKSVLGMFDINAAYLHSKINAIGGLLDIFCSMILE